MTKTSKQAVGTGSRSRMLGVLVAVVAIGVTVATSVQAQEERTGRVIVGSANVREDCSMSATVVGSRNDGDRVEIIETQGEWHRVRLNDGQEACMHESVLEAEAGQAGGGGVAVEAEQMGSSSYMLAAGDEESTEIVAEIEELRAELNAAEDEDEAEEIRADIAELEAELAERQEEIEGERLAAEREQGEAALRAREEALDRQAETSRRTESRARGERPVRGYLDFSYGVAWAASEEEEWRTFISPNQCGGVTDHLLTYRAPRGDAFSVGGGVLFGQIGGGLRLSQQTHEDHADIDLSSTCAPSFASSGRTEPQLERRERALHASFVWSSLLDEKFVIRLMVGPTLFDVKQDTVDDVFIEDRPPFAIVSFEGGTQDDTTVGFHVGADLSWYFGRFGLGVTALYASGEVELRDRFSETFGPADPSVFQKDVDVGGFQAGLGLRVRL